MSRSISIMTTNTPISREDGPAIHGLESPAGLPDEAELTRWANAIFKALPGLDGQGLEPSVQGTSAVRDVSDTGPLTTLPVATGGIGLSPTGIAPELLPHASFPAAGFTAPVAPGAGLSPAGVPGAGPISTPSLGGIGLSPDLPPASMPPITSSSGGFPGAGLPSSGASTAPGADLYILAEAQSRQLGGSRPGTDWLTARPDLLPGAEDLFAVLGAISTSPDSERPSGATLDSGDVPALAESGYPAFDVQAVRRDFPILAERINGRPLIWFDNGATTQKPQAVIDRLAYFYAHENSNVHRAAHTLAARASDAYENARKTVARFLGASSSDEIVFVRGTTEGINLVAQAWGRKNVGADDEIVISHLEHHANIVPWQQLAAEKGARLRVIPVDDRGQILLSEYERLLSGRTKIVAVTHVSNALGTVVPIEAVIARAHAAGAKVLIDGAQSVAHTRVDVQALDADFFVFSGHKIFAPTGIGVLYGKREILSGMPPWQGGGNMIADVTFERTVYQAAPARFEAGTGNLADAIGLGAALDYLERIGLENIARHEHDLLDYATAGLLSVPGLTIIGTAPDKASVLSFLLDGFTPQEVGSALDRYGIAVRAGHHCAQPILRRFGIEGTVRASLALYNTRDEVDCLVTALRQISASRSKGKPSPQ
jgi:cysteine desulfurase / selenocysteine lyase